jgi:uncharacterized protein
MISVTQENTIKETLGRCNPSFIGIFGSYARNEQNADILLESGQNLNLIDLIGFEQERSELLGIRADLITMRSLDTKLKAWIEKDMVRIV